MALDPNYGVRVREYGQERYPTAYAPAPQASMPVPPAMGMPGQDAAAPQGPKGFPKMVLDAQGAGPKLDPDRIAALKEQYITEQLLPREWGKKGSKEDSVNAVVSAFDSKANRWIEKYLAEVAENAEAANAPDAEWGVMDGVGDVAKGALGGLAQLVPAVASIADYGIRAGRAAIDPRIRARPEFASWFGEQTALGEWAANTSDEISAAVQGNLSERGKQAMQRVQQAEGFAGTLEAIIQNPASLPNMLGQGAASLAPVALLRVPRIAKAIQGLSTTGRAAAGASLAGVPYSAQSTAQFENDLRQASLQELLEDNPEGWALFDSVSMLYGDSERAKKVVKDELINKAVAAYGVFSLAANVGLATVPGLRGAEGAIAGATRGTASRVANTARGALSEAGQEGLAEATQTAGGNVGTNIATGSDTAILEGAGGPAAIGAVVGGMIGGGVGALQSGPPRPRNPLARTPPAAAPAPTATPPAPAATPAPATQTPATAPAAPAATLATTVENPGQGIPDNTFNTLNNSLRTETNKSIAKQTVKAAVGKLGADGVITNAINRAQRAAGNNWATLNPEQRLTLVETAIESLRKANKADGVVEALTQFRQSLNTETTTPPGPVEAPVNNTGVTPTAAPTTTPTTPPVATPARTNPLVRQPATTAPAPTPAPEPVAAPARVVANTTAKLPQGLAGAKPRWNNGSDVYQPNFESDIDKALYIAAGTKKSANDAAYRKFLVDSGIPENRIDELGQLVRQAVAAQMRQQKGGTGIAPARPLMPATNVVETAQTPPPEPPAPTTPAPKKTAAKKATKKAVAKKATTSPKTQAPAAVSQPGQPVDVQAAPATNTRETVAEAVERIAPDVIGADRQDLEAAIELAREGDTETLTNTLRTMQGEEVITAQQARLIREAARAETPAEQGLTVPTETRQRQPWDEGADTELETASEAVTKVLDAVKNIPNDGSRSVALLRSVGRLPEATKYQKWLAFKLADIVEPLGVELTTNKYPKAAGRYTLMENSVDVSLPRISTILHEYVHAATVSTIITKSTDPEIIAMQEGMVKLTSFLRKVINLQKRDPNSPFRLLDAEAQGRITYAASKPVELVTMAMTNPATRDFLATLPPRDTAKAQNLWEEFRNLLADFWSKLINANAEQRNFLDSVLDQSVELLQFAERNPTVVADLNRRAVFTNTLSIAFADTNTEFNDGLALEPNKTKPATNVDTRTTTAAGRLIERLAQAAYGIEESMRAVRKAGGTITSENNPYLAQLRYTSDVAENRNFDVKEFVEPIRDWITNNWRNFPLIDGVDQFRKELDKFLQAYHALNERNPTVWAETVDLMGDAEVTRAEIMERARQGELTATQVETELRQLAEATAELTLDEWAKTSPNAIDPEGARKVIDNASRLGLTPQSLAGLNELLERVRSREHWRRVQAGIVAESDPFARRPSWKWYVPLKDENQIGFNLGVLSKRKEFTDRNLKTIQGRQTQASNALESLVLDLNTSSAEHAEFAFKSALYEYVTDNQQLLGAKVREFTGTPKFGYTYMARVRNKKTGKIQWKERHSRELPNPSSGFVYNNGDTHFIVELPKGSRLDAGIKGIRGSVSPYQIDQVETVGTKFDRAAESQGLLGKGIRGLQTGTNILARAYTTWAPDWQLMVGFVRDIQSLPVTIGIDQFKNPWEARAFFTQYFKNLGVNTLSIASTGQEIKAILANNRGELRKYAEQNPDSYIARNIRFREAGGSTEFAQGLNRERIDDLLFGEAKRGEGGFGWRDVGRGYDKWNQVTSDWAAMLENKGRVAAFEAMAEVIAQREHNTPYGQLDPEVQKTVDREAAAITKSAMDYGQSGEWGKLINAWHAFYRVGATQIDVMRRIFTKPDGGIDTAKLKGWLPFFAAMGSINYMLLAAMLGEDDDGEPRIKKISPETLTKKMILPMPDGSLASASIGLGLPQLLLAPGTLGAAAANGHVSGNEAAAAYYDVLTSANLPISPTGWKEGSGTPGFIASWVKGLLVPTVADPIVEIDSNVNAFDKPIHTEWPQKGKFKSDMKMPHTQQLWADIAKGMRENFGIDMFPEDIKHLTNSYGGQIPKSLQRWTIDREKREEEGDATSAVRMATRGEVRDEEFYYRNEAREAQAALQMSERLMRSEAGNDKLEQSRWRRANPDHAKRLEAKKALEKALDAYYKRRNAIRDNSLMSPQGKRDQNKLADSALREAVNKANAVLEATE